MLGLMNNRKLVKFLSVAVSLIFIAGVAALAYTQMSSTMPDGSGSDSNVAYVNYNEVLTQNNPLMKNAEQQFNEYQAQLKKEYEPKLANADDQTKAQLQHEMAAKLQQKQVQLMSAVQKQVADAAKSVANLKGIDIVVSQDAVLYGGQDITKQVITKMDKEAGKSAQASQNSGSASGN
ncbi:MAG: OmpH family outer membrane protein [Veillonellaceae bacterium]|nr:OmpH family outer membrane protein [Veillonellaceae bacterium]